MLCCGGGGGLTDFPEFCVIFKMQEVRVNITVTQFMVIKALMRLSAKRC